MIIFKTRLGKVLATGWPGVEPPPEGSEISLDGKFCTVLQKFQSFAKHENPVPSPPQLLGPVYVHHHIVIVEPKAER